MSSAIAPRTHYIGRFAPSPTGPLHFGSLVAAVGSYLQARSRGGQWQVRIDDLDPLREQPGASAHILRTLEAYGLHWDCEVLYQSRRTKAYRDALRLLIRGGHTYYCRCTRKQIAATASAGVCGPVYPGTCRGQGRHSGRGRSLRVITHDGPVGFNDENLGFYSQRLESQIGDFVIRRADGYIAYHLAVVVDDAEQGITQVVRGADLLDSTSRQIYLQQLLGLLTPGYLHLPIAMDSDGHKLSKQTHAAPIPITDPVPHLITALSFLNQGPPASLRFDGLDGFWRWAIDHWCARRIPRLHRIELINRPAM